MKVSIIVPVYNVEAYLSECMDSFLCQTYQDYEIILVDDGSTDNSGSICDVYSKQYPAVVKTLHISNSGPLKARIRGIQMSEGDVLLFVDSDDTIRADALERIVDSFAQGFDMVLFKAETSKQFLSKSIIYPYNAGQVFTGNAKKELYRSSVLGTVPNCIWSKAVRRECATLPQSIECLGKVKYGEDLLLSACFITNCKKIVYLDEGLYHYRDRPGSTVHSFNTQRKESIKIVHTELEKCIAQWGMPELKPLHNARKVKGWIQMLKLLLKNRDSMTDGEYQEQLHSMSADPYFREAYRAMDPSRLSHTESILALCLMKKQHFIFGALSCALSMVRRKK